MPDLLDGGDPPPFRWLTYEEAAALIGCDAESVRKRARRHLARNPSSPLWQRQPGNDAEGRIRVAVPEDALPKGADTEEGRADLIRRAAEGDAAGYVALVSRLLDEKAEVSGRLERLAAAIEAEIYRLTRPGTAARGMTRHHAAGRLRRLREAAR